MSLDARGKLAKFRTNLDVKGLNSTAELFLTHSNQHTFRGMHLQWGSHSASKVITLISGGIDWFMIDCRPGNNYGRIYLEEIREPFFNSYAIPIGVAQGYLAIEDDTNVLYQMDKDFCSNCDLGLKSNKILDYVSEKTRNRTIISSRDEGLPFECVENIHP